MQLEEILSRFQNPRRIGSGFKVRCPVHDDQKNSLSITEAADGKKLIKCMASCDTKAVIDAVGLTWRDLSANPNGTRPKDDPVIARYVYVDEQQKPLFRVCRTRAKDFFQERFETASGKYIPGMNETRRVIYHFSAVLSAETVFVTEGEKDADKLASIGLTATTNPGGAGKWNPAYSQSLKDKNVVIIPDNDEVGQNHALNIARSALKLAKTVKLATLPGLPPKGDVSDYLTSHSKDDLLAVGRYAAIYRKRGRQRPSQSMA